MRAVIKTKQLLATAILAAASVALPSHAMVIGSGDVDHDAHAHDTAPQGGEFVLGPTTPGKWGSPAFGTGASVIWSRIFRREMERRA